jgi:hypothetical protein
MRENYVVFDTRNPKHTGYRIACEQLETGTTLRAYAVWNRSRRGRIFPCLKDIAPRDFAGLLRNAALLKSIDYGRDYEFRLGGNAHVQAQGFSFLGRRLSEIDGLSPGYGAALKSVCDRVCGRARPIALRGWLSKSDETHSYLQHESLFLPLGTTPEADQVLIVSVYMPAGASERESTIALGAA